MGLTHDSGSDFVKITIDSPGSIPITETSKIAGRIKNDENILSMFPKGCRIEVGTPGVGTKLVKRFQYEKNVGRKIYIEYKKNDSKVVSDIFRLISVENDCIKVGKSKNESLIMFESIVSAKIKISFD